MLAIVLAGLLTGAAFGAEPARERYNTVELQAEASREVSNDTLSAVLFAEANDASAAKVADALNRATRDALEIAGQAKGVQARSGGYRTYPVYDRNQRLTGWRGRAEVRLESRDFEAAAALIGKLQSRLQLASIAFGLAPQTRRAAENALIGEAIQSFNARAEVVIKALKGQRHKLRRLAIHTQGTVPPRPLLQRALASPAAEVAAPQFEGGQSTVSVSVTGTIEVE